MPICCSGPGPRTGSSGAPLEVDSSHRAADVVVVSKGFHKTKPEGCDIIHLFTSVVTMGTETL